MINKKSNTAIFLFLSGLILIVLGWSIFKVNTPVKYIILDILVSIVVFSLFFLDTINGFIRNDNSQSWVGSIGIRWSWKIGYVLLTVLLLIYFNNLPVQSAFSTQVFAHALLMFLLGIGFYFSQSAQQQVSNVNYQETNNRIHLEKIKKTCTQVRQQLAEAPQTPAALSAKIIAIEDQIRFISPSNNPDAIELEIQLINLFEALKDQINPNNQIDFSKIEVGFNKIGNLVNERKKVYSI